MALASQFKLSLVIGGALTSSFKTAIKGTQSTFDQLGSTLDDFRSKQKSIEKFKLARDEVNKARKDYREATQELNRLKNQINETGVPTREMSRAFDRAQANVARLSQRLGRNQDRLDQARTNLTRLGLSTNNLTADNRRLGQSVELLTRRYQRLGIAIRNQQANRQRHDQAKGQLLGAVAVGASIAAPLNTAINFEESIAKLGAISRTEGGALKDLSDEARKLGQNTQFSASQSAEAMQFLAMAGFETGEIMASTAGVLDLAQASGADLGRTADISSNILSGFSLNASEMNRVGNVLVGTFTTSNTTLESLGEAMKYVAPVAGAVGGEIEQVAAMVGLLGDVGLQGSMAGTALRTAFSRLSAPPRKAANALDELGIATKTASGDLRSMPDILEDIANATEFMGDGDRQEMITKIFGLEASSAITELIKQVKTADETNRDGLDNLRQRIKNLKDERIKASDVADRMGETTRGSLKRMGSALESVAISVGSLLLPTIAAGAEGFAVVASWISSTADRFPLLTKVVVGAAVGLAALHIAVIGGTFAFTFFKGAILSAKVVLGAITAAQTMLNIAMTANPIGLIIAGLAALVVGGLLVVKHWDTIQVWMGEFWEGLKTVTQDAIGWIVDNIGLLLSPFGILKKVISFVVGKFDGKNSTISVEGNTKISELDNRVGSAIRNTSALPSQIENTTLPKGLGVASIANNNSVAIDAPISIQAAPGVDPREIANEVTREFDKRENDARVRMRGNLYDGSY